MYQPFDHPQSSDQPQNLNHALSQLINLQAQQMQLNSILVTQQKTLHLPVKEPSIFSGNSFKYIAFVTAFNSIIGGNESDDKDRLFSLTDSQLAEEMKLYMVS